MATLASSRVRTSRTATASTSPKVYSYIRFSTPEQAEGDSERRQVEKARAWAKKHGYTFDESLRADRGRSAFHGHHRTKGYFGRFLQQVEAGMVPQGSILVVEELRRLTREGVYVGLKDTIFKLFEAGITIQTLSPETAYNRKTVEEQPGIMLCLMILLQLAHEESRAKSEWGNESWKQKRRLASENGKILTRMCPEWLEIVAKGSEQKFKVIPAAAKSILTIFRKREKRLGAEAIAKYLNAKAPWSPPPKSKKGGKPGEKTEGWNRSYVQKILTNRAVIGEYQPHRKIDGKRIPDGDPIPNYFPNLFAKCPGLFESVQAINRRNRGKNKGGRNGKATNLLQKLVFCPYCGGSMHYQDKGQNLRYLACWNKTNGKKGCNAPAMRYDEVESLILENCPRLSLDKVLPNPDEQSKLCDLLRKRVSRLDAQVREKLRSIDNLNNRIEATSDATQQEYYESRVIELREEIKELQPKLTAAQEDLGKAENSRVVVANWQADMAELKKGLSDVETRHRLNAHLKEVIERIEVFSSGHKSEFYPGTGNGDTFEEEFDALMNGNVAKDDTPFIRYAMERRMTKEGRFVRVHFKGSSYIDLVPEGSLASGISFVNGGKPSQKSEFGFHIIRPDINQLYRDYNAKKPKPR